MGESVDLKRTIRLYVSVDMEGIAGISHWDQIMATGKAYALGQRLVVGEQRSCANRDLQI
jgi:D-aminopeptidase